MLRWARASYQQAPPSLDQLAQFDRPHRIAIFNAIPAAARATLWREQLRRFADRADLTAAQRAFTLEVIDKTTAEVYAQDAAVRSELGHRYAARAAQLFTSRQQLAAFYDLGGSRIVVALQPSLLDQITRPHVVSAQLPYCECSTVSPSPECGGTCAGATCEGWVGCGWQMWYACNGICAW